MRKKTKTKAWVMWDLSLENFDNVLLVWIKFNFLLKLLFNHATLEKKKSVGCVGFKFRKFW